MEGKLRGKLNQLNQRLLGNLNIYTMETGDGRDIELAVVDEYICWRRVNDVNWIKLIPLSELKGDSPVKGIDYWTEEDKATILEYINEAVGSTVEGSAADAAEAIEALSECGILTPAYQNETFYTDADGVIYAL